MPHSPAPKRRQHRQATPAPADPVCYPQILFSLLLEHAGSWPAALALSSTCRAARSAWASSPWSRLAPAAAALHRCRTATGHEPSSFAEEIEQIDRVREMAAEAAVRLKFLRAARFWASTVEGASEALLRAVPSLRMAIHNDHFPLDGPVLHYSFCLMFPGPTDGSPHLFESIICDGESTSMWSLTYVPAGSVVARSWLSDMDNRAESLASSGPDDDDDNPLPAGAHTWKVELVSVEGGQASRSARQELCTLLAGLAGSIGCSPKDLTEFVFRMIEGTDWHVFLSTIFTEETQMQFSWLNSYLVEDSLTYIFI
eukprot:m51a1_g5425 hypothetical protein (313) ;mRNA; f:143794-144890